VKFQPEHRTHPLHIPEPLNDEHQSLLVVPHPAQEENHLRDIIPLFGDGVRALQVVEIRCAEEWHQPGDIVFSVQLDLVLVSVAGA
jgi:hypothetical protein